MIRRNQNNEQFIRLDQRIAYLCRRKIRIYIKDDIPEGGRIPASEYAIYNEYGTITIPARPFFRSATSKLSAAEAIRVKTRAVFSEVVYNAKDPEEALNEIGQFVVDKVKNSLLHGTWRALSAGTIARKNSYQPLVDTGTLYDAIAYEVIVR